MKHLRPSRAGFSLIELIASVAILLVLAGVVVPAVSSKIERARVSRAMSDMKEISDSFNSYKLDTGLWPSNGNFSMNATTSTSFTMMPCMYVNTFNHANWNGPYLTQGYNVSGSTMWVAPSTSGTAGGLLDPWGRPYTVFYYANGFNGGKGAIVLVSRGQDGQLDTTSAQAWGGTAADDDQVYVVTRRL